MRILSRKKRPMHLGKYPMEKIKRVDRPTTLITDEVKRVPRRAGFFVRAYYGDLGKKPAEEVRRFITKSPLNAAIGHLHWKQVPIHKGEPAKEKAPIPNDAAEVTKHIKSLCHFMDADMVGICEMPDYAWYSHDMEGRPITTGHKYAIVIVVDQGWDTLEASHVPAHLRSGVHGARLARRLRGRYHVAERVGRGGRAYGLPERGRCEQGATRGPRPCGRRGL